MHIVISGSREGWTRKRVNRVLDGLHKGFGITRIYHGHAKGVDTIADGWASGHQIEISVYEARWDEHGKAAGAIRNQLMIDDAHAQGARLLVAFQHRASRGTQHAIDYATKLGMSTLIVRSS